jgi:hypothetical protein
MTTSFSFEDYTVAPGQYSPEAFAHLHLTESIGNEHDAAVVLAGMVDFGRVALKHEDVPAYDRWTQVAADFVGELALDSSNILVDSAHRRNLTRLYFYGAVQNLARPVAQLQESLITSTPPDAPLREVMSSCAEHGIAPDPWIEFHTVTPDARADAWRSYVSALRQTAAGREGNLPPIEPLTDGADRFLDEVMNGAVSNEMVIRSGIAALHFVTNPQEKIRLIERFDIAVSALVNGELDREPVVDMMKLAAEINADPGIPPVLKAELSAKVSREIEEWAGGEGWYIPALRWNWTQAHAAFDISEAIASGADVPKVMHRIDQAVDEVTDVYTKRSIQEALVLSTVQNYARYASYDCAAAALTRINKPLYWNRAVEYYTRSGGDIDILSHAIQVSHAFDAVRPQDLSFRVPGWGEQRLALDFWRGMSPLNADYAASRNVIMKTAELIATYDRNAPTITEFQRRLACLLTEDPESSSIKTQLMELLSKNSSVFLPDLQETFALHGNELSEQDWEIVQQRPQGKVPYFRLYARLMLASSDAVR